MSRFNSIRIRNPYPFRQVERDTIIKVLAATYGVLPIGWYTEWYVPEDPRARQYAVDHIVFQGSRVDRRVVVTDAILFLNRAFIQLHHEPTSFLIPREVPPEKHDTDPIDES